MELAQATHLATRIAAALQPYCDKLEIVGSIRRQRPTVNDIDLVALPKPGQREPLRARCKRNCHVIQDGDINLLVRLPKLDIQVDIFIANPEERDLLQTLPTNFGTLLLCRTGSKEHNIWLIQHAKTIGLRWDPYHGIFDEDGFCLASADEQSIYEAVHLPYIEPRDRELPFLETIKDLATDHAVTADPSTGPSASISPARRQMVPPLPAGEGRGEGENPARPPASAPPAPASASESSPTLHAPHAAPAPSDPAAAQALADFRAWKAASFGP